MYAYISQKISLGKDRNITSVNWEPENDLISVGFNTGGIKLLKFEENEEKDGETQLAVNSNLSTSHQNEIRTLSWNTNFEKLLSVDSKGKLIVWAENLGSYEEEMINESPRKQIKFAKWSKNGAFIVIVIEGGNVILGSVEGDRVWETNLDLDFNHATFFENDHTVVLSNNKGEIVAIDAPTGETFAEYDLSEENENSKKKNQANDNGKIDNGKASNLPDNIVCFESNNLEGVYSRLLIAFNNGALYIVKNLRDGDMKKIDYNISNIYRGNWSKNGKIFAISGMIENMPGVFLFDNNAKLLHHFNTIKEPDVVDFNYNSTRLLVTHQSFIFLAKIRPQHEFLYLRDKQVFAIKVEKNNKNGIYLYNLKSQSIKKNLMENIVSLHGDNKGQLLVICQSHKAQQYDYNILDHNGLVISSKTFPFYPHCVCLKDNVMVASYFNNLIVWDYRFILNPNSKSSIKNSKTLVIDTYNDKEVHDFSGNLDIALSKVVETELIENINLTDNSIFTCNDKGFVRRYNFSSYAAVTPIILKHRTVKLFVSPDEKYVALIDTNNMLYIYDITIDDKQHMVFEHKEVWAFYWNFTSVNFCFVSKNRIYDVDLTKRKDNNDLILNEVVRTESYLLGFDFPYIIVFDKDKLADIVESFVNENVKAISFVEKYIIPSLSIIQRKIEEGYILEEYEYKNFDKKTIDYIASLYLLREDYEEAAKLYRYLNNYSAMKFVQRIKSGYQNNIFKRAEILLFLSKEREAIEYLISNNHENYIIKIFIEQQKYEELVQHKNLLDGKTLEDCYNKLGEHYYLMGSYDKSAKYYQLSNNIEQLIDVYFAAEKFDALFGLKNEVKTEEEKEKLARTLLEANMLDASAKVYETLRKEKKAVDIAILHNYWTTAVEIAERNNFQQIENLIQKFAGMLTQKKKKFELVQLYRKAKKNLEAAKILNSIAEDCMAQNADALTAKKLFVLSALEVNFQNKQMMNVDLTANLTNLTLTDQTRNATMKTIATLITSDVTGISEKMMANPWRGAEAWHLYLLTIRNLKKCQFYEAFVVANKLRNYELELEPQRVYAILAVSAYLAQLYKQFAKAINHLFTFYEEKKDDFMLKRLDTLVIETFKDQVPQDYNTEDKKLNCVAKNCTAEIYDFDSYCDTCGSNYGFCVVSGKSIFSKDYIRCGTCKHKLLKDAIKKTGLQFCSLCHGRLDREKKLEAGDK